MSTAYYIDYVDQNERVKVFDYNTATRVFTATAAAAARCAITAGASLITITVDGVDALTVSDAGLLSVGVATSNVAPSDWPRLEFMRKASSVAARLAYLSKAKNLWAAGFSESLVDDALDDQFRFFDLAAIGLSGVIADALQETL